MRTYTVYQVDAFTDTVFTGNPAGVVWPADGLSETEMQHIARELSNSETAFILSPTTDDHDVWLRYFTPTTEVPICGHATIAAHYIRAIEGQLPESTVVQKTQAGILPVDIVKNGAGYQIVMTQGAISFGEPFARETCESILAALSLTTDDLHPQCPVQIVSTGHSKVLIGVQHVDILARLQPDHAALTRLSGEIGCNGYFVFAFEADDAPTLTCGRMFAPAIGIPEDPVTGNANGPLGAYLVEHGLVQHNNRQFIFKARQGTHIGRPGVVTVTVDIADGKPTRTKVAGQAVTVFKAKITLPD